VQISVDHELADEERLLEEAGRIHVFPRQLLGVDERVEDVWEVFLGDVGDLGERVFARGHVLEVVDHVVGVL
jgi:hypothetical protein